VTYAPPGTDPTRLPSDPPKIGAAQALKDNWLLVVGVLAMLLFAPKVLGINIGGGGKNDSAQAQTVAQVQATPVPESTNGLPSGWCDHHGFAVRPGRFVFGDDELECKEGEVYDVGMGTEDQNEANLPAPEVEQREEQANP
jgi:hypothetical protein